MESETKTADVISVPAKPRSGAWAIARRALKYAIQSLLLIAVVSTSVSWYRSYHAMSDWQSPQLLRSQQSFFVGADRGTIYTGFFADNPKIYPIASSSRFPPFTIEARISNSKSNEKQQAFQVGDFVAMQRTASVDYVSKSKTYVTRLQQLKGHGFYFPHCVLVIVLGTIFVLVTFGRRFTLRGLMIWITVVCLLLGIQIAAANYQPPQEQGVLSE